MFEDFYKEDENGCWLWQAGLYTVGYGCYKQQYAHIYSYKKYKGIIPKHYHIHHKCKVKKCVNPDHLQLVHESEHYKIHHGLKEYCIHGHKYDDKNTRWKNGHRRCLACHNNEEKRRTFETRTKPRLEKKKMIIYEFKKGIDRHVIATKYGVSLRTVYRYGTPENALAFRIRNNWY